MLAVCVSVTAMIPFISACLVKSCDFSSLALRKLRMELWLCSVSFLLQNHDEIYLQASRTGDCVERDFAALQLLQYSYNAFLLEKPNAGSLAPRPLVFSRSSGPAIHVTSDLIADPCASCERRFGLLHDCCAQRLPLRILDCLEAFKAQRNQLQLVCKSLHNLWGIDYPFQIVRQNPYPV